MFAGRQRRSSNVRAMQIFHELKQQFPTIPDHIVTACISSYIQSNFKKNLSDLLESALAKEQMGHPALFPDKPANLSSPAAADKFPKSVINLEQSQTENSVQNKNDPSKEPLVCTEDQLKSSDRHLNSNTEERQGGIISSDKISKLLSDIDLNNQRVLSRKPSHTPVERNYTADQENFSQTTVKKKPFSIFDRTESKRAETKKQTNSSTVGNIRKSDLTPVANLETSSDRKPTEEMTESVSDVNSNIVPDKKDSAPKRPNTLDIKTDPSGLSNRLQQSEKCKDVHRLLNSPNFSEKPPRSPRSVHKNSPLTPKEPPKKETASTPTQTTDTLVNNIASPSVSVSLNVNVLQSPVVPKCTTTLQVTPSQPWLQPSPWLKDSPSSPRSFTSVNLTLRPPGSTPQEPIDITSQNSSLTYSTSSFDREKGLQSRLQITVGPGGANSVSSVRARPRSYHQVEREDEGSTVPVRAGSLNSLNAVGSPEAPALFMQQARIERMRIELQTEKAKLVVMKQEVAELEKNKQQLEKMADSEIEKQLLMEIKHLRCQCEQLALADNEQFYNNIYTGQHEPLAPVPQVRRRQQRGRTLHGRPGEAFQPPPRSIFFDGEGPKWSCPLCTFLNHPDLDKCEQCEMPRVLHGMQRLNRTQGSSNSVPASNITMDMFSKASFMPLDTLNINVNGNTFENAMKQVARVPLSALNINIDGSGRSASLGNVLDSTGVDSNQLPHITTSNSVPAMIKLLNPNGGAQNRRVASNDCSSELV